MAGRVRRFARAQRQALHDVDLSIAGGGSARERWLPLERVGLYVPGGRAFYPSTLVMTVVPAQEAGVGRIIATTPPRSPSSSPVIADAYGIDPFLLAAAFELGLTELYAAGGAQGIGWLVDGTPEVDLVAGPGNWAVVEAKRQIMGRCGIDSLAGPSELLILADSSADPAWVAEDLLAQAEHDTEAAAVLITEDAELLTAVEQKLRARVATSPRREILEQSLASHGRLFLADRSAAVAFAQAWAPEHLELVRRDAEALIPELTAPGALFSGAFSAEAFGDYGAGPNHVLPTARTARFSSPLGVATLMKRQSLLTLTSDAAATLAPGVERLAIAEGLGHHAESARLRSAGDATASSIAPLSASTSGLLRPDLPDLPGYELAAPNAGVRLHLNEASADWPGAARAAFLRRLEQLPFHRYPERQAELTERLRRLLDLPTDSLLLGPSGGGLLDLIGLAGLSPGDEVAIPDPGFSLYPLLVQRHAARVRRVAVGTGFPIGPWFGALDCRQLWLTLPNNPSGAWLPPERLVPLLDAARDQPRPPLVVIDEAYVEFAPENAQALVERYENVVVVRTFSKALASAGFRLGYLFGRPELVRRLAALQLPFTLSSLALEALDVALDFRAEFGDEVRSTVARRNRLAAALGPDRVAPSEANFLFVTPDPSATLAAAGITIRKVPGLDGARISIGSEAEIRHVAAALDVELT
jgi:histidinol dehydrogenase